MFYLNEHCKNIQNTFSWLWSNKVCITIENAVEALYVTFTQLWNQKITMSEYLFQESL